MGRKTAEHLGPLWRWYIYAVLGCFVEVTFTATWDFIEDRDWRLRGVSSVWALFIYGTFSMILEQLYLYLRSRCNLLVRGLLYTLCIYLWEFGIGYVLRCFHACPWDYSGFRYNLMGLITLEYCPFWFVGSLLLERLVVCLLERLEVCSTDLRQGEAWRPKQSPISRVERKDD